MTEERYFNIYYDDQFYIFDSKNISKEKVLEESEYSYDVFSEALTSEYIVKLLNQNKKSIDVGLLGDNLKDLFQGYMHSTGTFAEECLIKEIWRDVLKEIDDSFR